MAGPTVRRKQLGNALTTLRELAGLTQQAVATAVGYSTTKVNHQESGRATTSKSELFMLLHVYEADQEHADTLESLRAEADHKGWWETGRLPKWLAAYVGLEADATRLRSIELEPITGLLQTEDYALELHTRRAQLTRDEIDRRVQARMKRQARLDEPDPLQLAIVLSEAALQRCADRTTIGTEQLRYLHAQAQRPNIELRVLPFSAGRHSSMSGSFTLLDFPDDLLPTAAYQEYAVGGHLIDDGEVVAQLDSIYNELRGQALGTDESLAMIAELADDTR